MRYILFIEFYRMIGKAIMCAGRGNVTFVSLRFDGERSVATFTSIFMICFAYFAPHTHSYTPTHTLTHARTNCFCGWFIRPLTHMPWKISLISKKEWYARYILTLRA